MIEIVSSMRQVGRTKMLQRCYSLVDFHSSPFYRPKNIPT